MEIGGRNSEFLKVIQADDRAKIKKQTSKKLNATWIERSRSISHEDIESSAQGPIWNSLNERKKDFKYFRK